MRTFLRPGGRRLPRRRVMLAGATAFALAAAGIAIAGPGPASTTQVSATLTTNQVTKRNIRACTGTNNEQYQIADVTFSGTSSSSDANLNGQFTIHVRSVYDQTSNLGSLKGDVRIDNGAGPPPQQFHGHLQGVDVNGNIQALLTGNEHGGGHLIGSLTGAFDNADLNAATSFTGAIGAGSGLTTAIVTSGHCKPPKPPKPPKPHTDKPPKPPKPHTDKPPKPHKPKHDH